MRAAPANLRCRSGPRPPTMNLHDYLIDLEGKDWQSMLSAWAELLPATFTMWMVNRFGNVIVIVEDGSIHILDIHAATFEQVATSRDHFSDLADIPVSADDWVMIRLVDQGVAAGIELKPSRNATALRFPRYWEGNTQRIIWQQSTLLRTTPSSQTFGPKRKIC